MILTPQLSFAQPTCKDVIKKCDAALAEKNKALTLADLAMKDCNTVNTKLTVENTELKSNIDAWYHNPIIIGILGIAVGSTAAVLLTK